MIVLLNKNSRNQFIRKIQSQKFRSKKDDKKQKHRYSDVTISAVQMKRDIWSPKNDPSAVIFQSQTCRFTCDLFHLGAPTKNIKRIHTKTASTSAKENYIGSVGKFKSSLQYQNPLSLVAFQKDARLTAG